MPTLTPGSFVIVPYSGNNFPAQTSTIPANHDYSWDIRNAQGIVVTWHYAGISDGGAIYFNGPAMQNPQSIEGQPGFTQAYIIAGSSAASLVGRGFEMRTYDGANGHSGFFDLAPVAGTGSAPINLAVSQVY